MGDPDVRRVLIVLRHAQAVSQGTNDRARELTERGREQSTEAGRWLNDQPWEPTHAIVSTALRTQQTWDLVAAELSAEVELRTADRLYNADLDEALGLIRGAPADARTVVVVGHNPTVAELAHDLDGGGGDPAARDWLARGYRPATLSVFEVDVEWADVGPGSGRLIAAHTGTGAS